jgi:hypothetical protein
LLKLEYSKMLGRKIRKDRWDELGVSTWTRIKEAIKNNRVEEAESLIDYLNPEGKRVHDIYSDWVYGLLNYIGEKLGEEEIYKALRYTGELFWKPAIEKVSKLSVEELVLLNAESMRAHRCGPGEMGNIRIVEEADKYTISFDPCGSGGRMRRIGEIDGFPPRTGPPYNLGKTKKAYPWSWNKVGVPYYCTHCCVWSEIMPIEILGYPLRVCEYSEHPNDPCAWVFYKKPELIPDRYFERVGKKKYNK